MLKNNKGQQLQRRDLLHLIAMAGLTAAAQPGAWAQGKAESPEKTRITIAVPSKSALFYLPLTIAEQLGHFKAKGLDVEITETQGIARAQQAVLAGTADVVSGWLENTVLPQTNKQFFQAFVLQCRAP